MDTSLPQLSLLMDIETRHEDLLRQLDELDRRVQKTLAEWQGTRCPATNATAVTATTWPEVSASNPMQPN